MYATIQKWGNSQGLRIPKVLLESLGLRENDQVELVQEKDSIRIKRASPVRHRSLEERLTEFYGRPVEEIEKVESAPEVDWGKAKGAEVW